MIKYILSTLLLFVIWHSTAQEFRAGPLAGITFSQVDGDNYVGYNKVGLNLGVFVMRELSDKWELQLDIAFTQKGSRKAPKPDQGLYDDYKIHLNYFQFPLVARYQYKKISFEGGASIGALISSQEEIDGTPVEDMPGSSPVPFQNIEWATILGFNYHVSERLWLNARFLYSINRIRIPYDGEIPVYNPKPHWLSRKPGQYNNNFVVTVYYTINKLL